jgi:signal transduction histidine kinase
MPDRDSPAAAVLDALGFAPFIREADGTLRLAGEPAAWLKKVWPTVESAGAELPINDASPFLENFLIDAEECWKAGGAQRVKSGPWVEPGADFQLEATALTTGVRHVLLIERLGEVYDEKRSMLQKAREMVIAQQRLNSEIQKKEILLHCVADDMTAALANVITSLRLIEAENNGPRTKTLLGFAMRGAEEQQTLIDRVLDVFAGDLGGIYGPESEAEVGANWSEVLRRALEAAEPGFETKGVKLQASKAAQLDHRIEADAAQLERAVVNLLENALDHTPAGGEVAVEVDDEPEWLIVRVEDNAPGLSQEVYDNLFTKFGPATAGFEASALRLHFCRIMVENCGGEIGCTPRSGGGNRFWIRLPKSRATA